jgi:hypothetical protein
LRIFRRFEKFLMAAKKHPEAEEEGMEEAWDLYRCVQLMALTEGAPRESAGYQFFPLPASPLA